MNKDKTNIVDPERMMVESNPPLPNSLYYGNELYIKADQVQAEREEYLDEFVDDFLRRFGGIREECHFAWKRDGRPYDAEQQYHFQQVLEEIENFKKEQREHETR